MERTIASFQGRGGGWRKISSFSPSYKMGMISRSSSKGGGAWREKSLHFNHPNQHISGSLVTNSQYV